VALTREVSSGLAGCELTHLPRLSIDVALARRQHAAYEHALRDAGYTVERLEASPEMPDSVFIEDVAIVFDELAIVTRPGAESRRAEVPAVAEALQRFRPVRVIQPPGTIDGGDVLVAGRQVFVGLSTRTNADAARQMREILAPLGYTVREARVRGCLHLKSAVTAIAGDTLLANLAWIERGLFDGFDVVEIDASEPMAANALRVGDRVIYPTAFPRTADRLAARGLTLSFVDASEVAKAEGAVTCCSLIVN
jgi:dimethylargininase